MSEKDLVKEAYAAAEKEAREKQIGEVKKIVTKTLEKLADVRKDIKDKQEEERCKRVGLIHKGKLLKCDTPDVIKKECNAKTLEQAFISIINSYDRK